MMKTFNIYCDESTHLMNDGHPYMILGYISIAYPQIKYAKEMIKSIKEKYEFKGELKWTNVYEKTYNMYSELIDFFFMTDINFRALIIEKSQIDKSRSDYSDEDFYFKMYYQLLHHRSDLSNKYNIYFDIKDTCSGHKLHKLKEILSHNTAIERCQFIRSHESTILQIADVIMGAINYNLRIEAGNIDGKSIAKRKIVDRIKKHSSISLQNSTEKHQKKFNLFFISLK